jgi:hypothetical protein
MQRDKKNNQASRVENPSPGATERNSSKPNDLPDSKEDSAKLQPEETFIDLPDVKDIPGQEFVNAPPLGELGDTTISSDDEEGTRVFDEDDEEDLSSGTEGNVSRSERIALEDDTYMPTRDEDNLRRARMDNADFDGEKLNERGFGETISARDLDVPGSELDDRNEGTGEEDEENNNYSLDDNNREN